MKNFYRIFLLGFIVVMVSENLFSQGGSCASATSITVNGTCGSGSISNTGNSGPAPSCNGGTFRREGWYKFAVTGGPLDISITASASNRNLTLQVFSSCGGAELTGGCANDFNANNSAQTETLTLNSLANGTYYIRVSNYGSSNNNMNLTSLCVCTSTAPPCATYISPANGSTVCPISQTLSWNAIAAPACGSITYDVYFNSGTTATTLVSSSQAATSFITSSLSSGTTYSWKIVPRNGSILATGCSTYSFATIAGTSNSVAPVSDDFESCLDWTIVNGSETNQWVLGSATNNGGSQSMYISNDGGTTNAYSNSTSRVHFYKDIAFPAGQSCINLSFDWKSNGESTFDYLRVYAIPTSSTPVAGTAITSGQLGGNLEVQTTWQLTSLSLPAAFAGTTQRIVFSWVNDNSVRNQTPAAIDNISISTSSSIATPTCATYISPLDGASSCPSSQTLSWNAISAPTCGTITYDVYLDAGFTATTVVSADQVGTTYNTPGLSSGVYTWKVVPKNGALSATGCTSYSFTVNGIANDLPCNAVNIALGSIASGDNTCSSNSGEPTTPSCWTGGSVNSVWYSFTAPVSGNVKIRTAPGSLLNTQIALYSGTCGSGMTAVASGCNKNAPNCGSNTILLSELSMSGLTSGATYYVAVDGENSLVGTFAITIIESSSSYPITSGQTCASPNAVCTSSVYIGDPGNQGVGFTCDDDGTGNCTGGERGSVWYTIDIGAAGNLNFSIIPNDYVAASPGSETDYDFVLWKISGSGATTCASIESSGGNSEIACNYDWHGVTGCAAGGNAPAGFNSAYNASFEPSVVTAAGETYVLLIENYSNSTKGFLLDLSGSSAGVINYANPTAVSWTGGENTTAWTSAINWGSCGTPDCNLDATVSPISSYQPLVTAAMGTVTVRNLNVDPGAILNLGANSTIKVCGDINNNGTIVADPTSTILFSDDATHTLNGTLSGSSKLGNLIITDVAGSTNCQVIANTSIELKGDLTTSNNTSIFDINGKQLLISGNIINAAGANTFSNTAGSTITFNGSNSQTYNPNAISATPSLTLNNVAVNNSGGGVTISTTNTPNMILGTSGFLTLISGKIITPNNQEVIVMNTAPASINSGNLSSYVEGNLRRYLAAGATGAFDFPVGHATPGYERANVDFKTAAAAGAIQLVSRFDPWGGAWSMPAIPNWSECTTTYDLNYLNHGYWSIDASASSTGLYDLTLYNRGYSNATGSGYSIAKSPSASPSWTLNGNCANSPVTSVQRNSMSGFSKMATVQGNTPLPVELISFTGISEGTHNSINWKSAVETNFRHYELENSDDGINFNKIVTVNPIGNLSIANNYNYLDFSAYSPITYYRLKMVDLDYTFEYSDIIAVENGKNSDATIVVYPNPASNELFIKFATPNEKEAKILIQDIYGRIIFEEKINLEQTVDNTYINTTNFASGTYIVNITAGNSVSENIKVVISNKN
jgi:hypothetical protein